MRALTLIGTLLPKITGSALRTVMGKVAPPYLTVLAATGNGIADDTAAIQAVINEVAADGGGIVQLLSGTFLVTGLTLPSRVILRGAGDEDNPTTTVKLAAGANQDVIRLADPATTRACAVRNLWIDGNKGANTIGKGINFASAYHDPRDFYSQDFSISNVTIFDASNDALAISGPSQPCINVKVSNVNLRRNGGKGLALSYVTDSSFSKITSDANANEGIGAEESANNKFIDCKTFYNGTSFASARPYGWKLSGVRRSHFIGCEAQEDYRYGFHISNCRDLSGTILVDSNGREATPGIGIHIDNSTRFNLMVNSVNFHTETWQGAGVEMDACSASILMLTNDDARVTTGLSRTSSATVYAIVNGVVAG